MFKDQLFSFSDNKLNFASGPENGPPMVMLHGVTRCWQTFAPLLSPLSNRWHLNLLDFRGHGLSSRSNCEYLVKDFVEDAVAFVKQFDQPVLVYGHSLGAMVTAAVAAEVPLCVAGIILEDPPLHTMGERITKTPLHSYFTGLGTLLADQKDFQSIVSELAEVIFQDPETGTQTRLAEVRDAAAIRFSASCLQRLDPAVLTPIIAGRWLNGFNIDSIFSAIRCPTLLLQADTEAGGMLTDEDAQQITSLTDEMTHIKLPSTGHVIHWAETTRLANYVLAFIESIRMSS